MTNAYAPTYTHQPRVASTHIAPRGYSVYVIEGPSGVYVGMTGDGLAQRFAGHRATARLGDKGNPLYTSLNSDGACLYSIREVERCANSEAAREREIFWIRLLRIEGARVFNIAPLDETAPAWTADYGVRPGNAMRDERNAALTAARLDLGMTQQNVADALGLFQETVCAMERDKRQKHPWPTLTARRFVTYHGIGADELFARDWQRPVGRAEHTAFAFGEEYVAPCESSVADVELALSACSVREASILIRRVALDESLQEIADDFGITRERVRQLEATALAKARRRLFVANDGDTTGAAMSAMGGAQPCPRAGKSLARLGGSRRRAGVA